MRNIGWAKTCRWISFEKSPFVRSLRRWLCGPGLVVLLKVVPGFPAREVTWVLLLGRSAASSSF